MTPEGSLQPLLVNSLGSQWSDVLNHGFHSSGLELQDTGARQSVLSLWLLSSTTMLWVSSLLLPGPTVHSSVLLFIPSYECAIVCLFILPLMDS